MRIVMQGQSFSETRVVEFAFENGCPWHVKVTRGQSVHQYFLTTRGQDKLNAIIRKLELIAFNAEGGIDTKNAPRQER